MYHKSSQACQRCRSTKRKCDGNKPRCGTCARRGPSTTCVFDQTDGRVGKKSREIAALQSRIAELEREKQRAASTPTTHSLLPQANDQQLVFPKFAAELQDGGQTSFGDGQTGSQQKAVLFADRENAIVDGMGAMSKEGAVSSEEQFFGGSSTVGFVAQVKAILSSYSRDGLSWKEDTRPSKPTNSFYVHEEVNDDYILPTRSEADGLLAAYWEDTHQIYPLIDRAKFEREYVKLWLSGSPRTSEYPGSAHHRIPGSRIFHCLLNITFALGSQCKNQKDRSWLFWERCKSLLQLDFDIFNQGSVYLVQGLLLMGIYLQGTRLTGACWNLVGNAIRVAQGLGLHIPMSLVGMPNSDTAIIQHREAMRKRVWMSCLLMDRTLSVTYGRPLIVPLGASSDVEPQVDPSLEADILGYNVLEITFFNARLHLETILANAISALYDGKPTYQIGQSRRMSISDEFPILRRKVQEGDFRDIFKVENELEAWESNLPSQLRLFNFDLDPTREAKWNRHAVILRTRYLYGRILAFRPLLLRQLITCQGSLQHTGYPSIMTKTCDSLTTHVSNGCVESACELISLIFNFSHTAHLVLPEPCYSIFSMIILVAHISKRLSGSPNELDKLSHMWTQSIEALKVYEENYETAQTCLQLLNLGEVKFLRQPLKYDCPQEASIVPDEDPFQFSRTDESRVPTNMPEVSGNLYDYSRSGLNGGMNWDEVLDMAWFGTAPFDFCFQEPKFQGMNSESYLDL